MSNISSLLQTERVYERNRRESLLKLFMGPEQKNTARVKDVVQKFTKPEIRVVADRAGTFSVYTDRLLLPKPKTFVFCEVHRSCVTEAMQQLILLYAGQVLSDLSCFDGEEELCSSEAVYVNAVGAMEVRERLEVCDVPERPLSKQLFSPPKFVFRRGGAVLQGNNYSIKSVERNMAGRLDMYDIGTLVAVDCGAADVFLKKSAVPHKYAG